jgi:hypothetical protein
MVSKSDEIMLVLKDLKAKYGEITACMVAKRGLEGVVMFPESFKESVSEIWEPLGGALDDILNMISEKSSYNLDRVYLEMLGYGVLFCVLTDSDTALIIFSECNQKRDVMGFLSKHYDDFCLVRDKILQIIC